VSVRWYSSPSPLFWSPVSSLKASLLCVKPLRSRAFLITKPFLPAQLFPGKTSSLRFFRCLVYDSRSTAGYAPLSGRWSPVFLLILLCSYLLVFLDHQAEGVWFAVTFAARSAFFFPFAFIASDPRGKLGSMSYGFLCFSLRLSWLLLYASRHPRSSPL